MNLKINPTALRKAKTPVLAALSAIKRQSSEILLILLEDILSGKTIHEQKYLSPPPLMNSPDQQIVNA